jgi:uncharacterized protein YegL
MAKPSRHFLIEKIWSLFNVTLLTEIIFYFMFRYLEFFRGMKFKITKGGLKMKQSTHIVIVLDKSGSMNEIRADAIGGFNAFLADQKKESDEATITLVLFDHEYHLIMDFAELNQTQPLTEQTYIPSGTTALLDAIGRTIDDTKKKLTTMDEKDRPEKIVFVILTDGMENASQDYNLARVKQMIEEQTKAGWTFVYLAANVDAFATGSALGVQRQTIHSFDATSQGIRNAFKTTTQIVFVIRKKAPTPTPSKVN